MSNSNQIPVRLWLALFACACWFLLTACRGSQEPTTSNRGSADTRRAASTTPPFSTKEPDRYRAIRITTFTQSGTSSVSQTNKVLIARDGEKRREEYLDGASEEIVYLEIPAGRFILLPARSLYAELTTAPDETGPGARSDDSPGLSPDQLLYEAHSPATYEKLGEEMVDGRRTTKYRVVVITRINAPDQTLIWIDETLGMPVRSETISNSDEHSSKVTMELKDVKLEVDERLFSWPAGYRKVEANLMFELMRKGGKVEAPKQEEK